MDEVIVDRNIPASAFLGCNQSLEADEYEVRLVPSTGPPTRNLQS
jgi:hypothetical protein